MTNDMRLAATVLVGNKIYTLTESYDTKAWQKLHPIQREGLANQLKRKLADAIHSEDLMPQIQVQAVSLEASQVTYNLNTGEE